MIAIKIGRPAPRAAVSFASAGGSRSTVRVDAGLIVGMTSPDAKVGLTAGFTWVFKGFTIP